MSDVVIENFSVGVTQRLGIDYEQLSSVKPDLVMISMPAFGTTGPDSGFVAFGPQQECLVGLAAITGYEPGYSDVDGGVLPRSHGGPVCRFRRS